MRSPLREKDLIGFLPQILQDLPIGMAYLYGSYRDGTFNKFSDLDIALVMKETLENHKTIKMEMRISVLLDKKFGLSFDVRCLNNAPLRIKGEVITNGLLIYCSNEDFRVGYETFVRDRYFDFLPALRSMSEVYLSSVKAGGLFGQT